MWYLVENEPSEADSPAPRYWLGGVSAGGRLIGRKNVHIRIKQASVSRQHATLRVVKGRRYSLSQRGPAGHTRSTMVQVEDSSAYGTYVKYPAGHSQDIGHHKRLGKNDPTDVEEGALLAFGAPTCWWRLGWHHVLCLPAPSLCEKSCKTVTNTARSAGIEITDEDGKDVTHVVMTTAHADCMVMLKALARGAHVVAPAWLSSVQHTVQEACKLITEAQNNEAALAGAKLADETHFTPQFTDSDRETFPVGILNNAFSTAAKLGRETVFKNRAFAFENEEMRTKWENVLECMGAKTIVTGRSMKKSNKKGVIIVEEVGAPKRKRARKTNTTMTDDGKVTENSIIAAILSGDDSFIVHKEATVDIDEATDVEDEVATLAKRVGERKTIEDSVSTEKTTAEPKDPVNSCEKLNRNAESNSGVAEGDAEDVNEYVSFKVKPLETGNANANTAGRRTSGRDVRRFRRRNLPKAAPVKLKLVRYVEEEEEFGSSSRKKDHGNRGSPKTSGLENEE